MTGRLQDYIDRETLPCPKCGVHPVWKPDWMGRHHLVCPSCNLYDYDWEYPEGCPHSQEWLEAVEGKEFLFDYQRPNDLVADIWCWNRLAETIGGRIDQSCSFFFGSEDKGADERWARTSGRGTSP